MSDLANPIFYDENKAREWLEIELWRNGPVCPHCGSVGSATLLKGKSHRPGLYQCNDCRQPFTVTVGTLYERSKVPLHKWLHATHLLMASKKGMSALQVGRMLGLSKKTAWFVCHRIRESLRVGPLAPPMGGVGGVVEVDETIYGRASTHPKGRARNLAKRKITNSAHKNVIVSLVERGGSVRSYHVAGSTVDEVIPIVNANVKRETAMMTDSAQLYKFQLGAFASHDRVDHSASEYARYEEDRPVIHTNTVEGYFSVFKRGMRGTYQHCKEKHLHRYLAEFDFRYNNREPRGIDDKTRMAKSVKGIVGKRLTYRRPSKAAQAQA